jgi:hypothetical protein
MDVRAAEIRSVRDLVQDRQAAKGRRQMRLQLAGDRFDGPFAAASHEKQGAG